MNEAQFQMIWEKQLFSTKQLTTTCGKKIFIQDPGKLNNDQGPDFNLARLLIDRQEWVGSVELHLRTSDWYLHRHHYDPIYRTVILHVVWEHDIFEFGQSPVLELKPLFTNGLVPVDFSACSQNKSIRCGNDLFSPVSLEMYEFLDNLGHSRLEQRADQLIELLDCYRGDWDTVAWLFMAKGFGHSVNADAFFALARSIPFYLIRLYKYDQEILEALLYGQSGLLNVQWKDDYPTQLLRSYTILKRKYGLIPITHPMMFLRMRPSNFPTIRISQLACLYHQCQHVFRSIIELHDRSSILEMFDVTASSYWEDHHAFDRPGFSQQRCMGITMANNLIINVFVPILMAYSKATGNKIYKEKGLKWLSELRAESNSVIDQFKRTGFNIHTAYESQSILELHKQYCSRNLCHLCVRGKQVFTPS
ncbi:MAG: DUF2851 family protein [bacterium]